jgi:hypothetical protein
MILLSKNIKIEKYDIDLYLECVIVINQMSEEQEIYFEIDNNVVFLCLSDSIKVANVQF